MGEDFTIYINNNHPIGGFISYLCKNRYCNQVIKPERLIIDFSRVHFIYPYDLVSTSCLIEEYYINGVEIIINEKCNPGVRSYLNNIQFFRYWTLGFDRTRYTKTIINTVLCLWKIDFEMIYPYAQYATSYFQHHFPDLEISPLNIAITEIFNNINDHSKSPVSGYVTTQYYPNKKELVLSVCDFGISIPTSLNNYLDKQGLPLLSSHEALYHSLQFGVSSKSSPRNKGLGLNSISEIAKSLDTRLLIFSNNAYLQQMNDINGKTEYQRGQTPDAFPGTQIVMFFDTSKLEKREEEITEELFF